MALWKLMISSLNFYFLPNRYFSVFFFNLVCKLFNWLLLFSPHKFSLIKMTLKSVFGGKKSNNTHGKTDEQPIPPCCFFCLFGCFVFCKFNGNCTQLVLALVLFFNFRYFVSLFGSLLSMVIHVGLLDFCFLVIVIIFFFNLSVIILLLSFFCLSLHLLIFCLAVLLLWSTSGQ